MPLRSVLAERLGIRHPIIQAPMAGGGDTPDLVAAVSEAGGLGCIGAAYLTAPQIAATASAIRTKTQKPFGINLFAPTPRPAQADAAPAVQRVAPYFAELGLGPPAAPAELEDLFYSQLEAALDSGVALFSFTFGLPPSDAIDAIKSRGMMLAGTATTVKEAVILEAAGMDAVIAQGGEAGGHRGTFLGGFAEGQIGTLALVPQIASVLHIPVIASGGIMDGRGIAAAFALGAEAVQMGTAFLVCEEAGAPPAYKDALLGAREDETRVTAAFSGRPARGIANRFMREIDAAGADAILPFPLQNSLTRPLRSEAARQGRAEFLSLWAGQGVRLARRMRARDLMTALVTETQAEIQRLSDSRRAD